MVNITLFIIKCAFFFLPAYFANMAPPLSKNWLKFLAIPIDANIKFRNKPLFGKNKTIRGLIMAVVFAIIIALIQKSLYLDFYLIETISLIDYSSINIYLFGFLSGFGAIIGDLIESFFKRQLNIAPGKPFIPFDQLDFVIGGLIFINLYHRTSWQITLTIILISFFLHIIFKRLSYWLKIEKQKW